MRREELYKEFIEDASKCYIDALLHDRADIPALVSLYAKIGRMRVLSSPKVVASAEQIGRKTLPWMRIWNLTKAFLNYGTW